jgi:SAM-dependent methyltransferase
MSAPASSREAIWHDVECGAYGADLPAWVELASRAPGPVLELGAGTGRVALALAAAGHRVVALDASAPLLDELGRRAAGRGLTIETMRADARALELEREFGLILAPMQFVHLLGGPARREALLSEARRSLSADGLVAAAVLVDGAGAAAAEPAAPLLPDVREVDGWVYSSLPIEVVAVAGGLEIRRLRQVVSPAGEFSEQSYSIHLDELTADTFEAEAEAVGLRRSERIEIAATDEHVGSLICVLEAG